MATNNNFKVKNGLEIPSTDSISVSDTVAPSIRPSLNLDFANSKKLDPRITFTRASTATYYDGKAVAVAEQNTLPYSNDFASWSTRNGCTVTANATTAPDGTSTGAKLAEDTSSGLHGPEYQYSMSGATAPTTYTVSIYAKAAERSWLILDNTHQGVANQRNWFDLANGRVGAVYSGNSASITYIGNGWYRCSVTRSVSTGGYLRVCIYAATNDGVASYTGVSGSGIYIWGTQVEERAYATAYTPTTTSPITNYIPVLQTATANTARFDHDPITGESKGLLIEESRSNLFKTSQNFADYNWVAADVYVASNATVAPDGTLTASKIYLSDSTGSKQRHLRPNYDYAGGGTFTLSIYAKAAEHSYLSLSLYENTVGYRAATFNLSTGTVSRTDGATNPTITPVGNGWYRCSITHTATNTIAGSPSGFWPYAANSTAYDFTNGDNKSGVYVWGAQLELGAFATSYIPTVGTYVGRGSTATYRGTNGYIQTAPANALRYEPNSLNSSNILLEGSSANILKYSERFNLWNVEAGAAVAPNSAFAPDGSNYATTIRRTVSTAAYIFQIVNGAAGWWNGTQWTFSLWAKAKSGSPQLTLEMGPAGAYAAQTITLTTEWKRYSFTYTGTSTATDIFFLIGQPTTQLNQDIYIWGAQVEAGSTATSYIPSAETHTGRTSSGTYYDSTGVIRIATSGQPRYTYNPSNLNASPKLLLEAQSTNQAYYSEDYGSGVSQAPYNVTVTTNITTAPDGSTTADRLNGSTTAGTFNYISKYCANGTTGTRQTSSVFAKAGTESILWMSVNNAGGAVIEPNAIFNLTDGTYTIMTSGTTAAGTQYVGNGWWRCWISHTMDGSPPSGQWCSTVSVGNNRMSTGNLYLWGCQTEYGVYAPSSYISTTSATVTRSADSSTSAIQYRAADIYNSSQATRAAEVAKVTGSNFTPWYRQDQGTMYAEANVGSGLFPYIYGFTDGTDTNRHILYRMSGNATVSTWFDSLITANNSSQSAVGIPPTTTKFAHAFKTNDVADVGDGVVYQTDTSVQLPNINSLFIGSNGTTFFANGYIKKIAYYQKRLSNAELVSLTS